MAATPDGKGYWLVAADGGIFAFGDAGFYGSTGALRLNRPVVGMAATPDGKGYWLVAADGGIFTFGNAPYLGSTGGIKINQPIVGMAATPDGKGYWLVAADGGVFAYGDAGYFGSAPSPNPEVGGIVALSAAQNGLGYWIAGSDGVVDAFGDAAPEGTAGISLNRPIVGSAAVPSAPPAQAPPAPLSVATTPLALATKGSPYSASLTATGGTAPYVWRPLGALPAGLSLSSGGVITGTPSVLGTFTFTVQVTDSTAPLARQGDRASFDLRGGASSDDHDDDSARGDRRDRIFHRAHSDGGNLPLFVGGRQRFFAGRADAFSERVDHRNAGRAGELHLHRAGQRCVAHATHHDRCTVDLRLSGDVLDFPRQFEELVRLHGAQRSVHVGGRYVQCAFASVQHSGRRPHGRMGGD